LDIIVAALRSGALANEELVDLMTTRVVAGYDAATVAFQ
jgi:hypothetical protein